MTTTDMDRDTETGRSGRVSAARDKVREKTSAARERASDAYNSTRERTGAAYGSARENASYARQPTADRIHTNPASPLTRRPARGPHAAARLPHTPREHQLCGPLGPP